MSIERGRRTKIIWSYEAKLLQPSLAKDIVGEDFDVLRIVYDAAYVPQICDFLTALTQASKRDRVVPIMLDLPVKSRAQISPDYKLNEVRYGDSVTLTRATVAKGDDIPILADDFSTLFKIGTTIYFGYGNVVLTTKNVDVDKVEADVVQGGSVHPDMDVHVPATRAVPTMEQFEMGDLKKILDHKIDFLVFPGFSSVGEITKMREYVEKTSSSNPWFLLKLNSDQVYRELSLLLDHVQGVFVSRLELALCMEPAIIPVITKEAIQLCSDRAKIVITASEMLGSMRQNPTPTRAEVSDIANSVSDGADGVVLTEDIAYGNHSARAVRLASKIVEDVEQKHGIVPNWARHEPIVHEEMDAVAYAAFKTATRVGAKAIVCLTKEGNTAVKLSSLKTEIPIMAVTFSRSVLRRLSIVRGVTGILLESDPVIDQVLPVVGDLLKRASWLQAGDRIVFVSVTLSSLSRTESNLFTVQTL